jgi:plasmid stability protein
MNTAQKSNRRSFHTHENQANNVTGERGAKRFGKENGEILLPGRSADPVWYNSCEKGEAPMNQTVEAVFDGTILRPETALELEPNTRVRLTVEVMPSAEAARHGRTPAQEAQAILTETLGGSRPDVWAAVDAIRHRLKATGRTFSDSADLLREDRDR